MNDSPKQVPRLRYAFEARVSIEPEEHVGHGDGDELLFCPITGGTVDGPRLRGTVEPHGGDWMIQRGATSHVEARYLIRAEDGALIDIVNRGFYREAPDGLYFRTTPVFRTDAPAHRWLAETVFVGLAREEDELICIEFFSLD